MKKSYLLFLLASFTVADPELYFIEPEDGEIYSEEVEVKFGLKDFGVAPAGYNIPNTGHHHLIINADLPDLSLPIPANENYVHFKDIEFLKHMLDWISRNEENIPEYIVHLRPTSPLRDPTVIDNAIKSFINSSYSALRSCHKMTQSSYKTFEIENTLLKCICENNLFDIEKTNKNRQSYKPTYDANGYVDILRSNLIINNNIMHGNRVLGYITDQIFEIDNKNDLDFLEFIISKKPKILNTLFSK